MAVPAVSSVLLHYAVRAIPDAWTLPEGTVPESVPHDLAAQHLKLLLAAWAARAGRSVMVARNLGIRWLVERPQIGIDPDVCVIEPPPPEAETLSSLCLWKPGHHPPRICFEVVSARHPHKDYATVQDRYAAIGTRELVVFDPLRVGPIGLGGPVALQLWRRDEGSMLVRVRAGDEPAYSEVLGAWLLPQERLLEIADDAQGKSSWLTAEAHERAEKERERAEKERERAEKERERAEKEREHDARLDLERRLAEVETRLRQAQ